jgi:hypothetical protein
LPFRTNWGDPDLQGVWNWAGGTPLERPAALADKAELTDVELAEAERAVHKRANVDRRDGAGTDADVDREFNEFWHTRRTSILNAAHVVDYRSTERETSAVDAGG